jgi:trehalose 6-phosphate synthase/phosphatase
MSSFRNHRIVIASLFLPTTAVLRESTPSTPEQPVQVHHDATATIVPALAQRLQAAVNTTAPTPSDGKPKPLKLSLTATNSHNRQPSNSGPLESIVEDLKDKVIT